jgi:hypothetical protein
MRSRTRGYWSSCGTGFNVDSLQKNVRLSSAVIVLSVAETQVYSYCTASSYGGDGRGRRSCSSSCRIGVSEKDRNTTARVTIEQVYCVVLSCRAIVTS